MKTAEEWSQLPFALATQESLKHLIERIQLDAWKQGMTDAAGIVRMSKAIGKLSDKISTAEEVLAARHAKTEL